MTIIWNKIFRRSQQLYTIDIVNIYDIDGGSYGSCERIAKTDKQNEAKYKVAKVNVTWNDNGNAVNLTQFKYFCSV